MITWVLTSGTFTGAENFMKHCPLVHGLYPRFMEHFDCNKIPVVSKKKYGWEKSLLYNFEWFSLVGGTVVQRLTRLPHSFSGGCFYFLFSLSHLVSTKIQTEKIRLNTHCAVHLCVDQIQNWSLEKILCLSWYQLNYYYLFGNQMFFLQPKMFLQPPVVILTVLEKETQKCFWLN